MVILNSNDVFTVRVSTLIADYDRETITNLYQPLIGYASIALYFSLWSEASKNQNQAFNHETLLAKMQISVGEFLKARKRLEAVGLLKTYSENNMGLKSYHYELFAPKSPDEFFNDTLLYGLLINYLGEEDAKKLNHYYSVKSSPKGEDISASFKEVFHPDFESKAFIKALNNNPGIGRNRAKMKLDFNLETFFNSLNEVSQISSDAFSKTELKEIMRLASLNGVDEANAASVVADSFIPTNAKGKRVDFEKVTKVFQEETNYSYLSSFNVNKNSSSSKVNYVSSNGMLAQKVNMMESVTPVEYLTILQGGISPASADLNVIDNLSKKFKLPNSVINVIIEYSLMKNNNILSKNYTEKIAASLVRSGITTALDAMNYLRQTSKKKKDIEEGNYKGKDDTSIKIKSKEDTNDISDEEWNNLISELMEQGDGSDGKA